MSGKVQESLPVEGRLTTTPQEGNKLGVLPAPLTCLTGGHTGQRREAGKRRNQTGQLDCLLLAHKRSTALMPRSANGSTHTLACAPGVDPADTSSVLGGGTSHAGGGL